MNYIEIKYYLFKTKCEDMLITIGALVALTLFLMVYFPTGIIIYPK